MNRNPLRQSIRRPLGSIAVPILVLLGLVACSAHVSGNGASVSVNIGSDIGIGLISGLLFPVFMLFYVVSAKTFSPVGIVPFNPGGSETYLISFLIGFVILMVILWRILRRRRGTRI